MRPMNNNPNRNLVRRHQSGYAALAMVVFLAVAALSTLIFVFRQGMHSHEAQVRNQVKIDFRQKEDALLRALVVEVPNAAVGAMMDDSLNSGDVHKWTEIIARAVTLANAETAVSSTTLAGMGITGHISANSGDYQIGQAADLVEVIAGDGALVGPGNVQNTGLLGSSVAGKLPPALAFTGSYTNDKEYPIISTEKTYPASTPNLGASAAPGTGWPVYNIIDYPNIRFGFAAQGGKFVAKRNWWAFSVVFGKTLTSGDVSIPAVKRDYVLSIYEVPAQLALSAAGKIKVGAYEDGATWVGTTVKGGAFGAEVVSGNTLNLQNFSGGTVRVSARRSINLGGTATVGGDAIANGFDALGTREIRRAGSNSYYAASVAGDSGRVAILPLGQGEQFLRRDETGGMQNTVSPTPWDRYALGARQCAMQIEVRALRVAGDTEPTQIRFHYLAGGTSTYQDYNVGGLWVNQDQDQPPNTPIPFYSEILEGNGKRALTINLEKIPGFLATIGADDELTNNSLSIWSNASMPTVVQPQIPSDDRETAVVLRQCENLQAFKKGLSIVTDHRVYFAEHFNQMPFASIPANSGVPSGPYYPPVSVFAAEKRFGTNYPKNGNGSIG